MISRASTGEDVATIYMTALLEGKAVESNSKTITID
jgi:hypothetical protein